MTVRRNQFEVRHESSSGNKNRSQTIGEPVALRQVEWELAKPLVGMYSEERQFFS